MDRNNEQYELARVCEYVLNSPRVMLVLNNCLCNVRKGADGVFRIRIVESGQVIFSDEVENLRIFNECLYFEALGESWTANLCTWLPVGEALKGDAR